MSIRTKSEIQKKPITVSDSENRVLVADDDDFMRLFVSEALTEAGFNVTEFDPTNSPFELLKKPYAVVVSDIVMPVIDGFALRKEVLKISPTAQFIMITGHPDKDKAVLAADSGACSFLVKPFSADAIRCAVFAAIRKNEFIRSAYGNTNAGSVESIVDLVGNSEHLRVVKMRILDLAPLGVPVLITGESGTGKDVVAQNIHKLGPRANGPFVAVNCAALSSSLIESELFGHAQGAFTGAGRTKHGFFEVADQGTLFLDEIGELSMELQSKLLRVLDKGEYIRVGETAPRKTDVRIISATNRNLEQQIKEQRFRSDLFFRLRGGRVSLEPLRNRKEDIEPLVRHFLPQDCELCPEVMTMLLKHDWPGNIRELSMTVSALKGICKNRPVTVDDITQILAHTHSTEADIESYQHFKNRMLQELEHQYFSNLLSSCDNNITRAAQCAGMDRKNLREKLKKLNLHSASVD